MKIAIVTLVSDNYGNKLQNYAVEQLLSRYGEVETFQVEKCINNSEPHDSITSKVSKLKPSYVQSVLKSRMLYTYDITNESRTILGNLIYCMTHKKELIESRKLREESFRLFSERYLHISKRTITHENCREPEWLSQYDYFVCGSDQIWNPYYSTTTDLAFLSFASMDKSIAIAPSFGVSDIPEDRIDDYTRWLKCISRLSVREEQGQTIIRKLTGRDAVLLSDPTMAIDVEQWESISAKPNTALPDRYVLCYFLGRVRKDYKQYIEQQAGLQNAKIVNLFDVEKREYYILNPSEMLYCIKNAVHVYTDSFHGTVFSILFERDFTVFDRNETGVSMGSRLSTLLKHFDLNNHKYENRKGVEDLNSLKGESESELSDIRDKIKMEKEKFISYLDDCFGAN